MCVVLLSYSRLMEVSVAMFHSALVMTLTSPLMQCRDRPMGQEIIVSLCREASSLIALMLLSPASSMGVIPRQQAIMGMFLLWDFPITIPLWVFPV